MPLPFAELFEREKPVIALLNTGAKPTNVRQYVAIARVVVVGSDLKVGGHTWNPLDPDRVQRFLAAARP